MTISSTLRRAGPYSGNGVVTGFGFSYKVFTKTDVQVLLISGSGTLTTLTLDSDYSVTLNTDQNNAPGGVITYPKTGAPMPAGYSMLILGSLPISQPTDLTNSGGFYPNTVEDMVDRSTIQIQQIAVSLDQSVHFPSNETTSGLFPQAPSRANMLYGFDANGQPAFLPVTASVGAGDLRDDIFISSILPNPLGLPIFTAGVSTGVTLSRAPGTKANITYATMDGTLQQPNTLSLSGAVLTFLDSNGAVTPIPAGISQITVKQGTTLSAFVPMNGLLPTLPSVAALQVLINSQYTSVFLTGFADDHTFRGGGAYFLDTTDGASPDNGGSVIRNPLGCWKLKHNGAVSADVFGIDATGATDVTVPLQAMFDWCQTNGVMPELRPLGTYKGNFTLKHGRSSTDTMSYSPILRGNGATIKPLGAGIGLAVVPRCLLADAASGRGVAYTDIRDITLDGSLTSVGATGWKIGLTGFSCDGWKYSTVVNILAQNYTGKIASHFEECRHITIDRLVQRNGTLLIRAIANGSFTGDLIFTALECGGGSVASRPLDIQAGADSTNTNAQVRGVKFFAPVFYGSGARMWATGTGNAQCGDIWMYGPQFDGPGAPVGECALEWFANQVSQLFQLHIEDPYIVNYTGPAVYGHTNDSATMYQCDVSRGGIGLITCNAALGNAAVLFLNTEACVVNDVMFDNIVPANATSSYINLDGCTNAKVRDNFGTRSPTMPYGVSIGNASGRYSIHDNTMNCITAVVNDFSSGTPNKSVHDNLQT